MVACDQRLVHTLFVPPGSWIPCAPLVWNHRFPAPLGGSSVSNNLVKAPDIRFLSSQFRKYHSCHEKAKVGAGTNANLALAKSEKIKTMKPVRDREYIVHFAADTHSLMKWNFKPSQKALRIVPGETALAFYTAENPTDKPIIGIATYSVVPFEASKYFHKIQCFCFEEQRLNPHEKVDLPVFFFLDPEISSDWRLQRCSEIVLNYTFFEAKKAKFHIPGITTPEHDDTQKSEVLPGVAS
ncbi:unnamed protein product [Schistosoma margrebowiei]|uniref:Cytochrome c oxidase assembly protein COX11, mitochondrial n=1 Tax=Schistosoma margrebowiei TaxID=48269 RepID=A0A183LBT9_9TREM|nr:unnamed protein product [Schistosoma margrebowiei]